MIINQIDLFRVEVTQITEKEVSVRLQWKLEADETGLYMGTYIIKWYGSIEDTREFTDKSGRCSAEVTFGRQTEKSGGDPLYRISVGLPEGQGGIISGQAAVPIGMFQDISGYYDGNDITLSWRDTSPWGRRGICMVEYADGTQYFYDINPQSGICRICPPLPVKDTSIQAVLYETGGGISTGLRSAAQRFDTTGLCILEAELTEKGNAADISLEIYSVYHDLTQAIAWLEKGGEEIYGTGPVALSPEDGKEGYYTCTAEIRYSDIGREFLGQCLVGIQQLHGNARSRIPQAGMCIPLQAPQICVDRVAPDAFGCSLHLEDASCLATGFLVSGNQIPQQSFSLDFKTFQDKELAVRTLYNRGGRRRMGPSAGIKLFCRGYYPQEDTDGSLQMVYRGGAYTEDRVSCVIPAGVIGPSGKETGDGPITLKKDGADYKLEADTKEAMRREDFDKFILGLRDTMSVYGFYFVRECLMKMMRYAQGDAAYFYCSMDEQRRWADVLPGMGLEVAASVYMPQYRTNAGNTTGFSASDTRIYPVSLERGGKYLELDPFAAKMAQYMAVSGTGKRDSSIYYVSGGMDLLHPMLRQPYYRVLYPGHFTSALDSENPYPSQNFVLLAADSYQKMQSACDAIAGNPACINNPGIPVVIFRGRSSLSLRIPVLVNGERRMMPLRSVLGDVLRLYGRNGTQGVTMFRQTAEGGEAPVYLPFAGHPEDIMLLAGDRICFAVPKV